jgi:tRNA pseudouridine32 synthase/23S rRNA pseudouridine746 synthase
LRAYTWPGPATSGTAVERNVLLPRVIRSHIVKRRGCLQAVEEPGEPNAETLVALVSSSTGTYRLMTRTGRTHQLQMASAGMPIVNDPLYPPDVMAVPDDDFSRGLRLLAHSIEFVSRRELPCT